MTVGQLLKWQWQGYARYHQNPTNLLLHIVAVPLFLVANLVAIVAVVQLSLGLLALAILGIVVSVSVQGRGHKLEAVPPEPFTGPANALGRLLFEQWVTFPRFVLSGGWSRNLAHSRKST
jgi:phage terminase small subunit